MACKPYKANTHQEALKLVQLMANHGATADIDLDHRTVRFSNEKAWQKVKKQWAGMQVVRAAAESKSMMETKELI